MRRYSGRVTSTAPALNSAPAEFANRVRNAVAWRWGSQVAGQLITWAATILVVRLLDPHDYGLFAMTQAVLIALNFLNGYSFATSLIQAKEVDERRVAQVFGLLIVANLVLAAAQLQLAPLAARYYGQPMVADMLRVQALVFLTTPFIALPSALLARRMEFRSQALVNLICSLAGAAVALLLAWRGYGVWALVLAPIAMFVVRAIGLTMAARLLVWPSFNFRGSRDVVRFGTVLTVCQLFWIVQSQTDIFIAGSRFAPHDLGLYSEALFLTLIFTGRFLPPLNEVAFPAYAELAQHGHPLAPAFLKSARLTMLLAAPLYVGLSLTASPLVATLFGPKWLAMAPIVAGLAVAMPAMALQIVCSPTTNALALPRIYLRTSLFGAVVMPLCFLIGVRFGPQGLVHSWQVAAPALLAVTLALTLPAIGLRLRDLVTTLAPVAAACGLMAIVVLAARMLTETLAPPAQLTILVAAGGLTYCAALFVLWRRIVRETWAMLRKQPPA
ncbi:MAG TPA: lipopolysaccharide biosynthesis protein [Novosphingobium sp.]|nr:lipopolysaccharide biosynthesis protein [Novosphingobium sp.]